MMTRMSPMPWKSAAAAVLSTVLAATSLTLAVPAPAYAHETSAARGARLGDGAVLTGRVVVRYRAATPRSARLAASREAGARRAARISRLDVEVLAPASLTGALQRLKARREVLWAEPEVLAQRYAELTTTPERRELALDEARAADARFEASGVRVAVIDDGVFPIADLAGRVVDQGDCSGDVCLSTGGVNAIGDPGYGPHGTAVAAIIAAGAGNGIGIVGAAPRATIWSYRVFPDITAGASDVSIANAIMAAADDGADVANLSLGTPFDSQLLRDAVGYARRVRPDMVIVAASGNDGGSRPGYPAGSPTVLSVGASALSGDGTWRVADFSTRGDVDVLAPGQGVRTWYRVPSADNPLGLGAPTAVETVEGTSFAAPEVAGILAGLAGVGIRGDRARAAVVAAAETALPVTGVPAAASGAGRADALTALSRATGSTAYSAMFVDNGSFVARDVGVRRVETLRVDTAPASGADGPAPLRVEAGGGQLSTAAEVTTRAVSNGQLVRAVHTYRATSTVGDEVRLAAGAAEDDGTTRSLRLLAPTAGPEGVPTTTGEVADVDLSYGLTSMYVRTANLSAGQLLAIEFSYASATSDVAAVVWAPPTTGGVARPSDSPDAVEESGATSGTWVFQVPRTGTYAFGLVSLSSAGDGRHRFAAHYPVLPHVTAPARVLTVGTPAVVPLTWGLAVGTTTAPLRPGALKWDVALQTVSRDRLGRILVSAPRTVVAGTTATSMSLVVGSVGRYRVQVRPSVEGAQVPWSPGREFVVLPLRPVR